ncbi:MAG: hypothetical protein HZB54_02055 [Deltaproteobacteria bacterium]|nr:hypothetical protein [Deltaproteobacteria bacterium]
MNRVESQKSEACPRMHPRWNPSGTGLSGIRGLPLQALSRGQKSEKNCFYQYLAVSLLISALFAAISGAAPFGHGNGIGSYIVATIAGSGIQGNIDGSREKAQFNWPTGIAVDDKGYIYVADFLNNLVRKINNNGEVITFIGSGHAAFADGNGRDAHLKGPDNIAVDKDGNIYVADADNFRIRKVTPDGIITTIAGSGIRGYKDGEGKIAMFAYPTGVDVDKDGNVYVADRGSHTIRKIERDKNVVTIAGNGYPAYADGNGVKTHFREPISLTVDHDGNIYVADSGNNAIRKITPDGIVSTLAGGKPGYKDGKGRDAKFLWPTGVAIDGLGNIYVCDSQNNKIRRVTPEGVVSTVAGVSVPGFADGAGYNAQFRFPTGIGMDKAGNIYVADSGNNRIRKISQGGILQAKR